MNFNKLLEKPKRFVEEKFNLEIRRRVTRRIPHEAINVTQKVIFVAVPKTGSTSVRTQVKETGKKVLYHPHLNYVQLREVFYIHQLFTYLRENQSFPTTGVLTEKEVRKLSDETFDSYFKFSSVRNPWARAAPCIAVGKPYRSGRR